MPRRPPRLLVVASAILLAAVVALWVRSYWRSDVLVHYGYTGALYANYGFISSSGLLRWVWWWDPPRGSRRRWERFAAPVQNGRTVRNEFVRGGGWWWMGFGHVVRPGGVVRDGGGAVAVPFWFLAALAGLPLAWAVLARRRRPPPGHCPSCGYDLTANASGRCPECGSAVSPGLAAPAA